MLRPSGWFRTKGKVSKEARTKVSKQAGSLSTRDRGLGDELRPHPEGGANSAAAHEAALASRSMSSPGRRRYPLVRPPAGRSSPVPSALTKHDELGSTPLRFVMEALAHSLLNGSTD